MYKINKLPNGLEVITAPVAGTKTVTALVMAATGAKFENRKINGISHFLEHMFFKGTAKRPNTLAISSELDRVGGEFNAFTGKEYTGYYVKVEASHLDLALDVLSDMLLNSKFDSGEIEREKGVIIEELNMYQDNPLMYIEDLFETCLYGDTPAGWDTVGTKETITGFKRKDFLDYAGTQYSADKIVVALAGRLEPGAENKLKKYFSKFAKKNYRDKSETSDLQSKPKLKLRYKKTDQAHLSLGVRALPYNHEDELIAKVIAMILGGTMSSRLFIELRERRGLAYYVRSHDEPYTDTGYLTTQAGVPLNRIKEAIEVILNGYKKLTKSLVEAEELNRLKQGLIGRSALQLETSENVANWYVRQAVLAKEQKRVAEILTPESYYGKIKKITPADISRVAKKLFTNEHLNLAIIGPYGEKEKGEFEKMLSI